MTRVCYNKQVVSERIRQLRKRNNLTLVQLSESTDIPLDTIKGYERKRESRIPDTVNLKILSKFFRVSEEYILGESDFED